MPGLIRTPRALRAAIALLAGALTVLAMVPAHAQYPEKSLNWIVMWRAGGGADTATRTFIKYFEPLLGQSVVVQNRTGGGGSIGYLAAKESRPDGYNLVTIQGDLPKFKPMNLAPIEIADFDVIGGFAFQSPIIIVRADSPFKTMEDLIEAARKNPGQVKIGVSDIGGIHHQPIVLLEKAADIKLRAVAHEGSPQMNAAILGGHVDAVSSYIRPAVPYVEEGKLRFLAYTGTSRPEGYDDVPTLQDLGYDVSWEQPYGIGGPAGMPEEARKVLAEATRQVRANPQFRADLNKLGLSLYERDGKDFEAHLKRMQSDITEVLRLLKGG